MPTSTKHLNLTKPDPTESGKTVTYNADLDKIEAGRTVRGIAGATIGAFQAVRYDGATDRWLLCDDDDVVIRGIAQAAVAISATGYFQVSGVVTNTSWTWTIGSEVFVSATAGTLTQTAPFATSRPIGIAIAATEILMYNNEHLQRLRRGLFWDIGIRELLVVSTGSGARGFTAEQYSADAGGALVTGRKSRNATEGAHSAALSGDALVNFIGAGSDGTAFQQGGIVRVVANENWGGSARGSRIVFFVVANATTALIERMRLVENTLDRPALLVGGLTAPTDDFAGFAHLDVRGPTAGGLIMMSTGAGDADATQIGQFLFMDRHAAAGDRTAARWVSFQRGATAGDRGADLIASTKRNGGTITDIMYLDEKGNVILGNKVALATGATDEFAYIPSMAGTPTGTPSAFTGKIPLVYDSTNNILYAFSNGAWRVH